MASYISFILSVTASEKKGFIKLLIGLNSYTGSEAQNQQSFPIPIPISISFTFHWHSRGWMNNDNSNPISQEILSSSSSQCSQNEYMRYGSPKGLSLMKYHHRETLKLNYLLSFFPFCIGPGIIIPFHFLLNSITSCRIMCTLRYTWRMSLQPNQVKTIQIKSTLYSKY